MTIGMIQIYTFSNCHTKVERGVSFFVLLSVFRQFLWEQSVGMDVLILKQNLYFVEICDHDQF